MSKEFGIIPTKGRRPAALALTAILFAGCTDRSPSDDGSSTLSPIPTPAQENDYHAILSCSVAPDLLPDFLAEDPAVWTNFEDIVDYTVAAQGGETPAGVNADVGYEGEENLAAALEKASRLGQLVSEHLELPVVENAEAYPAQQDIAYDPCIC